MLMQHNAQQHQALALCYFKSVYNCVGACFCGSTRLVRPHTVFVHHAWAHFWLGTNHVVEVGRLHPRALSVKLEGEDLGVFHVSECWVSLSERESERG